MPLFKRSDNGGYFFHVVGQMILKMLLANPVVGGDGMLFKGKNKML
jgi:hypothetical protein